MISAKDELLQILRPPGNGIVTYSAAIPWIAAVQQSRYNSSDRNAIEHLWTQEVLATLEQSKGFFLGLPTDVGAAVRRGAATGPIGFRYSCMEASLSFFDTLKSQRWLDIGDVLCHPFLLSDDMLNTQTIHTIQKALWGDKNHDFPVSPMNLIHLATSILRKSFPHTPILSFGGDHSVSYPLVKAFRETSQEKIGVLHFDAHTDLRSHRMGSLYNFTTWAYHVYKMDPTIPIVQVGIRSSSQTQSHFEQKFPTIRQFWIKECQQRHVSELVEESIEIFHKKGINQIYISCDVDALDPSAVSCTGTPEENGLQVDFVHQFIQGVCEKVKPVGADIVEFAPTIGSEEERKKNAREIEKIAQSLFKVLNI